MEHPGAAAHRMPPRRRDLGRMRLSEDLAVELEHRVAADHDPVEVGDIVGEPRGDRGRLPSREEQDVLFGGVGETLSIRHLTMSDASYEAGIMLGLRATRETRGLIVGLDALLDLGGGAS